jgi:hypothetical protein
MVSKETINHVGFNQDRGCMYATTDFGFKLFQTEPFRPSIWREFEGGI